MASSSTKEDLTFLQLLQDKYLECSLCIGDYRQPKSLACLHTFCLGCLQDFVKHNPGDIVCPTCRDITLLPKDGVKGLKSNFLIKALTDEAVLFKNQSVKCDNCDDGENIATMVCVECAQYLCSTCYKSHQALKVIRDSHNTFEVKQLADIVNLREFQKNRFSTCQIHKDPMKLYCKKDSIQLCHTCAFASTHRGHIVCPLQEQLDDLSTEIEKALSKCVIDEDQVKTENMKFKELVDLAKQTEEKSLDHIDNEEMELINILKEKYNALREEIKQSSKETIASCQNKIEKNNALMKSYKSKVIEKDGLQMIPITLCIEAAEGVLNNVREIMKISVLNRNEWDEQHLKRFESKENLGDITVGSIQCQFPSMLYNPMPVPSHNNKPMPVQMLASFHNNIHMSTQQPAPPQSFDPMSMQMPASSKSYDPMSMQKPASSKSYDPMPMQMPASSKSYDPMSMQMPASSKSYDPMPMQMPASSKSYDPMSMQMPASSKSYDPMSMPKLASSKKYDPMPMQMTASSKSYDPMPMQMPASSKSYDPMSMQKPASSKSYDPMSMQKPASSTKTKRSK